MLISHAVFDAVHYATQMSTAGIQPANLMVPTVPVDHAFNHGMIVLAQASNPTDYADAVKKAAQEEQLGWLTTLGKHFIGVFQKGGEVFVGFVTGIIPTLVVLMTAFYAIIGLVGEDRVHGVARAAGRIALTRYTVLPVLAVFFLTNPMAYTFGSFLEERHKPAFYDSAVSFVHPILGLFPHANPANISFGAAFSSHFSSWKRRGRFRLLIM